MPSPQAFVFGLFAYNKQLKHIIQPLRQTLFYWKKEGGANMLAENEKIVYMGLATPPKMLQYRIQLKT